MSNPFFIFGIARSGTNLLARMMDRHPEAVCALDPLLPYFKYLRSKIVEASAPESLRIALPPDAPFQDNYFVSHGPLLLDLLFQADGKWLLAAAEQADLRARIVERAALESIPLSEGLANASGGDLRSFLDDVLRIIGLSKTGARWSGSKEVWVIDFLPLLARMYPGARFFLIERDPRAIVASLLAMGEKDSSQAAHFVSYARHWRKAIALRHQFMADSSLAERVQVVSYEQLVREPVEVAKKACMHLRVEYRPEMLEVSATGWAGNSSYGDNRGIYGQSLEKWRDKLGPANINAVEFLCAPEMTLTPYDFLGDDFGRLTPQIERILRAAGAAQSSWRSDFGHPALDIGGELLRYEMLKSGLAFQEAAVRECFLAGPVLDGIRAALAERQS